jgi:hypothetical protein
MKKINRLTENSWGKIISESIKKVLKEDDETSAEISEDEILDNIVPELTQGKTVKYNGLEFRCHCNSTGDYIQVDELKPFSDSCEGSSKVYPGGFDDDYEMCSAIQDAIEDLNNDKNKPDEEDM